MRIGRIIKAESSGNENEFIEINGAKIFAGLTFAGLIGGLVTFFTFMLVTYPQNKNQIEYENDLANFQYINFVLRNENDTIRKESFKLLLKAGIIEETEKGLLVEFIERNGLPNWSEYKDFIQLSKPNDILTNGNINDLNSSNKNSKSDNNSNSSNIPE